MRLKRGTSALRSTAESSFTEVNSGSAVFASLEFPPFQTHQEVIIGKKII